MTDTETGDQRRETHERLRRIVAEVAREEGLRLVVLFGSGGRDDKRPPEDLDLAIRGMKPVDLVALTNRFIQRLGRQDVDLADLRRADPVLMVQVARDGIPWYESEPGEFARFHSLAYRRFADTRKFREAERREIEDFVARREASR